jgi:hypothetical protein
VSVWNEVTDFDIDHSTKEVDFFVMSDNQGNIYLSASFDQIKYIYEKILEKGKTEAVS